MQQSAALTTSDLLYPTLGRMPRPTLRSVSALGVSWQCQRYRRCSSCRAWRDGIAPLSKAAPDIVGACGSGSASFCFNKNNVPNNASLCKIGSLTKRGAKRKSYSSGLGGMLSLHPLPLPSPLAFQTTYTSITPPLLLQCRGIYDGKTELTFAARSMEHTANQLRGVKSFVNSLLSMSRSICLPYQGVDLFSVPSSVADIATSENVAATVLFRFIL